MYYFTFVNFKQFGLLLEAIHLRSFCGEFLISGDDNLRSFLPVSYRSLELLGSESLGTWLEDSRLAASPKVSIRQRSFCGELLYLGPRSEILVINFSLYYLSRVIFGAMTESSSNTEYFLGYCIRQSSSGWQHLSSFSPPVSELCFWKVTAQAFTAMVIRVLSGWNIPPALRIAI